jgi:erythrocyte band 7 integral membrane protein
LRERTKTTLREVMGSHDLQDAIVNRVLIAREIEKIISTAAKSWGAKIESILIKDVHLSDELQDNLSAAAKQRRIGASKVIAAEAEVESAKLMREASDILNTPAAMQIRYLETLKAMAHEPGTKVIFMPPSFSGIESSAIVSSSPSKPGQNAVDLAMLGQM